jgi:hypothetical protein
MRKTVRGALINLTRRHSAGTQHWSSVWLTGSGKAGPVPPVRTHRRQNHVRQPGRGAERLSFVQKLRQLSDVHRTPPRLFTRVGSSI